MRKTVKDMAKIRKSHKKPRSVKKRSVFKPLKSVQSRRKSNNPKKVNSTKISKRVNILDRMITRVRRIMAK